MGLTTPIDTDMCLGLLSSAMFGRVALNARALPRIVPVKLAVQGRRINAEMECDQHLGGALDDAVVALQADGTDARLAQAWSVHVVGRVTDRSGSAFVIDPVVIEGHWLAR